MAPSEGDDDAQGEVWKELWSVVSAIAGTIDLSVHAFTDDEKDKVRQCGAKFDQHVDPVAFPHVSCLVATVPGVCYHQAQAPHQVSATAETEPGLSTRKRANVQLNSIACA